MELLLGGFLRNQLGNRPDAGREHGHASTRHIVDREIFFEAERVIQRRQNLLVMNRSL